MPNEKSTFNHALAAELRAERAIRNFTQRELIERSGIPKQTLIRVLKGERDISVTQLATLSNALGVAADVFIRRAVERADAMLDEAAALADATEAVSDVPDNVRHIGDKRSGRSGETPTSPKDQTGAQLDKQYRDDEGDIAAINDPEMDDRT